MGITVANEWTIAAFAGECSGPKIKLAAHLFISSGRHHWNAHVRLLGVSNNNRARCIPQRYRRAECTGNRLSPGRRRRHGERRGLGGLLREIRQRLSEGPRARASLLFIPSLGRAVVRIHPPRGKSYGLSGFRVHRVPADVYSRGNRYPGTNGDAHQGRALGTRRWYRVYSPSSLFLPVREFAPWAGNVAKFLDKVTRPRAILTEINDIAFVRCRYFVVS